MIPEQLFATFADRYRLERALAGVTVVEAENWFADVRARTAR